MTPYIISGLEGVLHFISYLPRMSTQWSSRSFSMSLISITMWPANLKT